MSPRVLLAATLPLLAAVSPGCVRSHACTTIGCANQATIAIHRPDWATLALAVELDIDGRKVLCAAPGPQQGGAPCDSNVSLETRQLSDCHDTSTDGAISQTCTPNGRFEEVITIRGTPDLVAVTLKSAGAVVGQRTFQLAYTSSRPNGPDCDPLCRQSTQTWEIGASDTDAGGGDTANAPADATRDAATDATADAPNDARPDAITSLDAPTDGAPTDSLGGGPTCGTMTCAAGDVCVRVQTLGGACFMPGDAGCPAGFSPGVVCCEADPTFHCAPRPPACGSTLTCACAASALCTPGRTCTTPTTTQINCTLLAP
jgi:hypothetical protein